MSGTANVTYTGTKVRKVVEFPLPFTSNSEKTTEATFTRGVTMPVPFELAKQLERHGGPFFTIQYQEEAHDGSSHGADQKTDKSDAGPEPDTGVPEPSKPAAESHGGHFKRGKETKASRDEI